jgi:cell volume regulation protein A
MSTGIIIALCILVLIAYLFDITASRTRIPAVILLLLLGYAVKVVALSIGIPLPALDPILPVLGTIGLILIVLEGALELQLDRTKFPFIRKSMLVALLPMLGLSFTIAGAFYYFDECSFKDALSSAIPFAVISSAIAIPSARNLDKENRSFVTYESSFSDIFGVVLFNFVTENDHIGTGTWGQFIWQILLILVISFVATLLLALFMNNIRHHIKFAPIIVTITLIYFISKVYHLPALIFILLFGLFLENIDELRDYKFFKKFHPERFSQEVHKFKELTGEFAFLVRASFFMLFGFLLERSEILNHTTIAWAIGITATIFLFRGVFLKLFRLPLKPLVFMAPRGLITILLFLSIPPSKQIALANNSLIIQVIILCALVMMIGLMKTSNNETEHQTH